MITTTHRKGPLALGYQREEHYVDKKCKHSEIKGQGLFDNVTSLSALQQRKIQSLDNVLSLVDESSRLGSSQPLLNYLETIPSYNRLDGYSIDTIEWLRHNAQNPFSEYPDEVAESIRRVYQKQLDFALRNP